jgi:hypothetical protein
MGFFMFGLWIDYPIRELSRVISAWEAPRDGPTRFVEQGGREMGMNEFWTRLVSFNLSPREMRALREAVRRYRLHCQLGRQMPLGRTAEEIIERVAPFAVDPQRWHELCRFVCDLATLEQIKEQEEAP